MECSDKEGIRILIQLLAEKGVKRAVLSPGSRNAPLLLSFAREPRIKHFVLLDERSAAFFALGMAQQSGEPVALVCTSGTALLNYAPAIAEAWYKRIPLLVISADRPAAWIDQDDSQTIRQNGILNNIVKSSWLLPVELKNEEERWYSNRIVNDAINDALKGRKGPVHLNVPLGEPLYAVRDYQAEQYRKITFIDTARQLDTQTIKTLANQLRKTEKVMIIAGFGTPDQELQTALQKLATLENIVILTENISNLDTPQYITTIDRVLSSIPEKEQHQFTPDLLLSFGGPLVSKQIKHPLRNHPPREHWSLDNSVFPADTFKCLTTQINLEAKDFFCQLEQIITKENEQAEMTEDRQNNSPRLETTYSARWTAQEQQATVRHNQFINTVPWSDLKAFSILMPSLPDGCSLQLSNGTPVRYAQLFKHPQVARRDGNRGTSGIEGATSVAVGAASLHQNTTILITGDMSFLYDSNALWNKYITPRLKIIVMKNGGGGIFRFIPGPSDLQELEECFETAQNVNIQGLAETNHFQYFKADSEKTLKNALPHFLKIGRKASILEIETPRFENGKILKEYFTCLSNPINIKP